MTENSCPDLPKLIGFLMANSKLVMYAEADRIQLSTLQSEDPDLVIILGVVNTSLPATHSSTMLYIDPKTHLQACTHQETYSVKQHPNDWVCGVMSALKLFKLKNNDSQANSDADNEDSNLDVDNIDDENGSSNDGNEVKGDWESVEAGSDDEEEVGGKSGLEIDDNDWGSVEAASDDEENEPDDMMFLDGEFLMTTGVSSEVKSNADNEKSIIAGDNASERGRDDAISSEVKHGLGAGFRRLRQKQGSELVRRDHVRHGRIAKVQYPQLSKIWSDGNEKGEIIDIDKVAGAPSLVIDLTNDD
jgi:hypothetical protein